MVKKDNPETGPLKDTEYQTAIEEKVRQMLDPEIKNPEQANEVPGPKIEKSADGPSGAPTLTADSSIEAGTETDTATEAVSQTDQEVAEEAETDEPQPLAEAVTDEDPSAMPETAVDETDDYTAPATIDIKKPGIGSRFKTAWRAWWRSPIKRSVSLAVVVIGLLVVILAPPSRYFILNSAGVRGSASLIILDDSTTQPLKNVNVTLGGQMGQTDKDGKVRLQKLRLGKNQLVIEKRAFAPLEKTVVLGWGSNPLGTVKVKPVGSQYSFTITDYLSSKPVHKAEAVSQEATAISNENGEIKLTLDTKDEQQTIDVTIQARGYREEKIVLNLNNQQAVAVQLVPDKPHVFVSRRSGRYDVYRIDADGKNEQKVLSGSGSERDDLVLVPHPSKGYVALVSTRENVRNRDGFLLSTLTLIDLEDNTPSKLAQSERIQLIDWVGDRLVYVQIAAAASAESPQRHRLMSYDLETGKTKELAAANYFNDVLAIGNNIFYAPSGAYSADKAAFFKIAADGGAKQTVLNQEVWNVFRTDYDKLVLAVGQEWQEYHISSNKSVRLSGEPANLKSRVYVESPDRQRNLWIDQRDGKGVLLAYNVADKEDKTVHERSGLNNPVRWLNDSAVIFRVSSTQETADYVMSLDGGQPRKLKDVTNTSGIDRWYYY